MNCIFFFIYKSFFGHIPNPSTIQYFFQNISKQKIIDIYIYIRIQKECDCTYACVWNIQTSGLLVREDMMDY